jgi:arylsulfatase B
MTTVMALLAAVVGTLAGPPSDVNKPHIVMILSDDYGWADVGYHNEQPVGGVPPDPDLRNLTTFATPTIDQLVKEGIEVG